LSVRAAHAARKASRPQASAAQRMAAQADRAADLLKALSNAQRLRVLCLLADAELSVGELNTRLELSQSALSQHLAVLREHGLVCTRRESQTIYYALAEGPVRQVIATLHDIYCPLE
jgi:ArsR family transcriptional regulator, virulence genes transcriptional regulator